MFIPDECMSVDLTPDDNDCSYKLKSSFLFKWLEARRYILFGHSCVIKNNDVINHPHPLDPILGTVDQLTQDKGVIMVHQNVLGSRDHVTAGKSGVLNLGNFAGIKNYTFLSGCSVIFTLSL